MQILEKGFGCCSLHVSVIVVHVVHLMIFNLTLVAILFDFDMVKMNIFLNMGFSMRFAIMLLFGTLAGVFSYSCWTILQHKSSMLTVTTVLLCVLSYSKIFGIISMFDLLPFSYWISYFFVDCPFAVFNLYSAWILYSYKIQFREPVRVNV